VSEALAAAIALIKQGLFAQALTQVKQILEADPNDPAAWLWLARLTLQLDMMSAATQAAAHAARLAPASSEARYVLGRVHKAQGNLDLAIVHYGAALRLNPADVSCLNSLGVALRSAGRTRDAVECYRMALSLAPGHMETQRNLANALAATGFVEEATNLTSTAAPRLTAVLEQHVAEARRLHAGGEYADSVVQWSEALRLAPDSAALHCGHGNSLLALGRWDPALEALERAMQLAPDYYDPIELHRGLATSLGLAERAQRSAARALALRPTDLLKLQEALVLPAIMRSNEHIDAVRADFGRSLDALLATPLRVEDPISSSGAINFYLAYHGRNNRELQQQMARVSLHACPTLQYEAPHCRDPRRSEGRIRIGLASEYLHFHSIGKTTRGFLAKLPRERYEVFTINLPSLRKHEDDYSRWMRDHSDHWIRLDTPLARAREQLGALGLDVLFWQDIGMSAYAYYLAFGRYAPVQCVSFGHPDTTGLPAMDYFVSNDLYELDPADHYSEQLFLLHDLPTLAYYYRPSPETEVPRSAFGFADSEHLYFCAQTLFKLHPDFDAILADILRRDPRGRVLLIRGLRAWSDQLQERFRRCIPDVADRISFLEPMNQHAYLQVLQLADVVLDTPHFNGMNSSLEAFSVGTPVVTLPTALQRGRHTQAMYRKMEIDELIARNPTHYADIALAIATQADYRAALRRSINERSHVLYESPQVVTEFCRFFEYALQAKAAG
jgi:predicted O-linked N-acetylglucosamine transferase (SPINDLY family)